MNISQRVQIPAHLDQWMMGDRFGAVTSVINHPAGHMSRVRLDKSGKHIFVPTADLKVV